MPTLGKLLGPANFTDFFISLNGTHYETLADAKKAAAPTINYGQFVNTVINFLIVAFAVYLLVQEVNRWTKEPAPAETPTAKECPQCAMAIPIKAKKCPYYTAEIE